MERMVKVTNMVDAQVGITDLSVGIKRRWQKRGQSLPIPFDQLQILLYNDGVANMFNQGMLYIDNKIPQIASVSGRICVVSPQNGNKLFCLC